jgi:hypothetical protein
MGAGTRAAFTPWPYARRFIRQLVSFEAGFFDSWKGGDVYVDYRWLHSLQHSKDCWLPDRYQYRIFTD